MIDIQKDKDSRGVYINKVGIKAYVHPIKIKFLECDVQNTVSKTNIYVDLEADVRAIHMSRLIDAINSNEYVINFNSVEKMLDEIMSTMNSCCAQIEFHFPYFMKKEAPISKKAGVLNYDCIIYASKRKGGQYHVELQVSIPVCSICPCSKAISNYGAHNQRGILTIKCEANSDFNIENIIRCGEKSASAELFALLKREDEKYITEFGYDNAKFVEDIARDAWINLKQMTFIRPISVSAENFESIHNHNAYSEIKFD